MRWLWFNEKCIIWRIEAWRSNNNSSRKNDRILRKTSRFVWASLASSQGHFSSCLWFFFTDSFVILFLHFVCVFLEFSTFRNPGVDTHTHTKRKRASLIAEYVKYHDWSIPNRFGIKIRRSIYQNLFYLTHRARTHELPFLGSKWNSNRAEPAKKHTNLSLKNRVKRQEKRKEARQNDNKIPFGTKASGERKKHSPNETKYDNTLWTKINIII